MQKWYKYRIGVIILHWLYFEAQKGFILTVMELGELWPNLVFLSLNLKRKLVATLFCASLVTVFQSSDHRLECHVALILSCSADLQLLFNEHWVEIHLKNKINSMKIIEGQKRFPKNLAEIRFWALEHCFNDFISWFLETIQKRFHSKHCQQW